MEAAAGGGAGRWAVWRPGRPAEAPGRRLRNTACGDGATADSPKSCPKESNKNLGGLAPVDHVKGHGGEGDEGGETVIDEGVFEFIPVGVRFGGEDLADLCQHHGKEHDAEVLHGPEAQGHDVADFGGGIHLKAVGGHHQIEGDAQEKAQVQQDDEGVFEVNIFAGVHLGAVEGAAKQKKRQYQRHQHEQGAGPDVDIEDDCVHSFKLGQK